MCILNAPKTNNNILIVSGSQTSLSGLPTFYGKGRSIFSSKVWSDTFTLIVPS